MFNINQTDLMVLTVLAVFIIMIAGLLIAIFRSSPLLGNLRGHEAAFQLVTILVLSATGIVLYLQLDHLRAQGETQRIVAARNSLQEMNKLIMDNPAVFSKHLFPALGEEGSAEFITAAAALNAWEVVYHMQKEHDPSGFEKLLSKLVKGSSIETMWNSDEDLRVAYHKDFQALMNKILGITPPDTP